MTDVPEAAVVMSGVTVAYGANVALQGFQITVAAGERVALVGPSGAGKTTVLSLCTGAVRATSGSVCVLDQDLATAGPRQLRDLRRRVGTVYQRLHVVGSLKVVHNVNAGRLGAWTRRRAILSLLKPAEPELAKAALGRVGIADKLHERTDRLSGGEQQRVALARVLRQQPDLILADEPVSSLDPARSDEVMSLLSAVVDDLRPTLLVSLHDFDLARRWCDRMIGIRAGATLFDLPVADVTDELGRELYRLP